MSLARCPIRVKPEHRPLFGMRPEQAVLQHPAKSFKSANEANRWKRATRVAHDDFIAACADDFVRERVLAAGGFFQLREHMQDHHLYARDVREMIAALPDTASVADQRALAKREAEHVATYRATKAVALQAEPATAYDVRGLLDRWIAKREPRRTGKAATALKSFVAFLEKPTDFRTVTRQQVVAWRNRLETEGASWYVTRDNLRALSAMFAVIVDDMPNGNPCKDVLPTLKKPDTKARAKAKAPTVPEVAKLLETAAATQWGGKKHGAAMVALEGLARTGARPSEFLQLQKGDVRRVKLNGSPVVLVSFTQEDANAPGVKHPRKNLKNGDSARVFPLCADNLEFGERLLAFAKASPTDQLFEAFPYEGEKGFTVWFSQNFGALRERAELPDSRVLYGLRHRAVKQIDNGRLHPAAARRLTGHGSADVRDSVYAGDDSLSLAELANEAAKFRPLHDYGASEEDDAD